MTWSLESGSPSANGVTCSRHNDPAPAPCYCWPMPAGREHQGALGPGEQLEMFSLQTWPAGMPGVHLLGRGNTRAPGCDAGGGGLGPAWALPVLPVAGEPLAHLG